MANRRMFSKTITNSSQFLMMPQSSQNLYFHLGMNADDDGFCEHFTVMRMTESKPDDLKVLQAKGFIKIFDDRVLVIIDWKENNYLRNDRYSPSKYLEIYKEELKELGSGIPNGNQRDTQVRLGKVRLDNIYTAGQAGRTKNNVELLTDFYFALKGWEDQPKSFYKKNGISYGRNCKSAKDILTLCDESLEKAKEKVEKVKKWAEGRGLEWSLETVSKKFLEV